MATRKHSLLSNGFTVVEMLIVVVVVGILATITVVSYRTVTTNARDQAVSADLQTVAAELGKMKSSTGNFPSSAGFSSDVELSNTSGETEYTYNYDTTTGSYCLAATGYDFSYHVTSTNSTITEGDCQASGTPVIVTNRIRDPSLTALPGGLSMTGATGNVTLVNSPGNAHSGSTFVRLTLTSSGATTMDYTINSSSIDSTMLPDTPYTASIKFRPSKTTVFNAAFVWTDTSGNTNFSTPESITANANQWSTLWLTGQSSDPVTVRMRITTAPGYNWSSGDTLDIDSFMLTEGSTVYEYHDGTSSGWVWNGTANNSSSYGPTIPQAL